MKRFAIGALALTSIFCTVNAIAQAGSADAAKAQVEALKQGQAAMNQANAQLGNSKEGKMLADAMKNANAQHAQGMKDAEAAIKSGSAQMDAAAAAHGAK